MIFFAKRLKDMRKDNQKTQNEMAKLLGVRRSTYGEYERGVITPPIDKIQILADYFDVSLDYLVGNTNFQTAEERNEINPLDIAQQMKSILECLQNSNYALLYEGDELAPECREFLKTSFESNLKMAKLLNSRKNRAVS